MHRPRHQPGDGKGDALRAGFEAAEGDIIVTLDADCTYPAEDIPGLSERLFAEDLDFITTNRLARMEEGAMSAMHRFGNWMLNVTTKVLFSVSFKDSQSGMWVFRREAFGKLNVEDDGMPFSEEIKIEAIRNRRIRFGEISIQYSSRLGEIKLNPWRDGFNNLWFLVRKRFS